MATDARRDVELRGCALEPLMAYLKALGVLRVVAEQKDPTARGWWKNDTFCVRSGLDDAALVEFFLADYAPTPIVAPWAGGSGFFGKDNTQAVDAIATSAETRLAGYRCVIDRVRSILNEEGMVDKPSADTKVRLLRRYRAELPQCVVDWIDAATILRERGQTPAPLLGTGGNDGHLDFAQNFMGRLVTLGIAAGQANPLSKGWLLNALFAAPACHLGHAAVGQFAPGRAGGANATQGLEGRATDNPWDFVLMLEGTLVLAGAAVRRLAATNARRASFPFTVRSVAAGYPSDADHDEAESRGEIWLPVWSRPTTIAELRTLFAEGRADVSGTPARDGLDFARAVATLGVDRGIERFSRYSFLKRNGKAYLAPHLGRFEVHERSQVDLLREIDPWLAAFRRAAGDKNAPPRFRSVLHRIDRAAFALCRLGGTHHLQSVLVALGQAERALILTSGKVGGSKATVRPISSLSSEWAARCDDGSPEFAIARALASLHDAEHETGPFRTNLEPVSLRGTPNGRLRASWVGDEDDPEKKHRTDVWTGASLARNLAAVLERRCIDGKRAGCENLPLVSSAGVGLDTVAAFIHAEVDDDKIEELLWGLILLDVTRRGNDVAGNTADGGLLPRAYALLKLLFIPRPLAVGRHDNGALHIRFARHGEEGVRVKPEPLVLHLLHAGRIGDACVIAMRRLRAAGINPLPHPIRGRRVRDEDWRELQPRGIAGVDPQRLAAALLIPISDRAVDLIGTMIASPRASEGAENV